MKRMQLALKAVNELRRKEHATGLDSEEKDTSSELIIFKEDGQEYAQVLRMLGDGRMACTCYDGVARVGLIRGAMRKKTNFIHVGNIVIVGLRYDSDYNRKCDIVHLYTTDEANELESLGELSINVDSTPLEERGWYIKYQEELASIRAHEEKQRQKYLPKIPEIQEKLD